MQLKSKKKIGSLIIAMTVITSSACVGSYFDKANTQEKTLKVVVAKGDTIWSISKSIVEEHGIKEDIRKIVHSIQKH